MIFLPYDFFFNFVKLKRLNGYLFYYFFISKIVSNFRLDNENIVQLFLENQTKLIQQIFTW